jgi:methionyl-tRNA formyltransferase
MSLKIIFCGTPEFSVPTLQALLDSPHEVIAVYTPPDRPAGRGQKLLASPIKELAITNGLPVLQPKTLRDIEAQKILQDFKPDLMVVVAYGLILPPEVLSIPKYGCINVHASLLPHWRGAAPIQRAILAGDKITGVTIMQMDKGLDTGDMLLKRRCEILPNETSESLHDRLSLLGAKALIEVLPLIEEKALMPEKQNDADSSYAEKIQKQEAKIDWKESGKKIHNLIRAFYPWPVAFTDFKGQLLRIWRAEFHEGEIKATPGTLLNVEKNALDIATRDGILRVLEVQMPNAKRMGVQDFINAHRADLIPMKTRF